MWGKKNGSFKTGFPVMGKIVGLQVYKQHKHAGKKVLKPGFK